jgi:DNA-binding NtrC family response regulator
VITERSEALSLENPALRALTGAGDPPRPRPSPGAAPDALARPPDRIYTLEEMERRHILSVLRHAKGSKAEASRLLKISRPTLDRKIARFRIDLDRLDET